MSKVSVSVEVSKEMHELVKGLANIVRAAKLSLKDGFQPGQDLPLVLVAAVSELPVMVAGLDQLPSEAKSETAAFIQAAVLGAGELVEAALA
jgi:hypothetical protein